MSIASEVPNTSDTESVHSVVNLDAISLQSVEQIDEAVLRQSVLAVLGSPDQMAALSDEERQRVEQMAASFWPEESAVNIVEELQEDDASDESDELALPDDVHVTQDENLARTMLMLHGEMGASVMTGMPNFGLFELIRSIAKIVTSGLGDTESREDAERSTMLELLNCSSAGNLMERLESWPACNHRLLTCAASSEFASLFADIMHEFCERHEGATADEPVSNLGLDDFVTCQYRLGQCDVCCSVSDTLLWTPGCCDTSVCVACLHRWLTGRLTDIHTELGCPGCARVLTVTELRHLLSEDEFGRRQKLLARHSDRSRERDCPRCSCLALRPVNKETRKRLFRVYKKMEKEQGGVLVKCEQCDHLWCFDCHSPAHPGLTCRQHRSGAHLLESWAKKVEQTGLRKARRCPRCKVMIEKNDGCNHITCVNCRHEFCYICRKRWHVREVHVPYFNWSVFGSHSTRLSVFGCSQTFMRDRPCLRRFIRGCLFVLRACGLVVVPTVGIAVLLPIALALLGIAIPLAPIIIPAVLIYMKMRKRSV